jgi:hypothetical protein
VDTGTPAPSSTLSVASLMMGIIGWILLPVVGGITGHLARKEIRQSEGLVGRNNLATGGLVLGYSNVALWLCGCLEILLIPAVLTGVLSFGNQLFNASR